ncbi:hypothetical protein [Halopseudomonas sabulinigri]|uniref:Uncharacterized protein n=1 Tax=Halopseudomonas sabulinigri TaxID=472181 RepID=A0ABP9ZRK6_9GAMM
MKNRLPILIEMRERHLPVVRKNAADSSKDATGTASASLAGTLEFLAVAYFVRDAEAEVLRRLLAEACEIRLSLFRRFDAGEPISVSYASQTAGSQLILNALAAADFKLADRVAALVGGRPEIEKEFDHPFSLALGYALKHLMLGESEQAAYAVARFVAQADKAPADRPYGQILQGILSDRESEVSFSLSKLEGGHKRLVISGRWKNTEHELVCLWGLGLWNLALRRGIRPSAKNSFIPGALLISGSAS